MSNRKEYSVFHMHVKNEVVSEHSVQAMPYNREYLMTATKAKNFFNYLKNDIINKFKPNITILKESENSIDYIVHGVDLVYRIEIKKAIRIEQNKAKEFKLLICRIL